MATSSDCLREPSHASGIDMDGKQAFPLSKFLLLEDFLSQILPVFDKAGHSPGKLLLRGYTY